jgi:hypothetical protein
MVVVVEDTSTHDTSYETIYPVIVEDDDEGGDQDSVTEVKLCIVAVKFVGASGVVLDIIRMPYI